MAMPIRMTQKNFKRLLNKQDGKPMTNEQLTRRIRRLEKMVRGHDGWLVKLAAKILHNK